MSSTGDLELEFLQSQIDSPGSRQDLERAWLIQEINGGGGGSSSAIGAGVGRTLKRLKSGTTIKATIIGDSIADKDTPGNAGAGPLETLAPLLEDRFDITVNTVNHATSGFTALRAYVNGNVSAAVAEQADLVFICLGKNDIGSDIGGPYAPGYPLSASMAAVERMCAAVRKNNDTTDIIIIGEGPYKDPTSSSNPYLKTWEDNAKVVAAAWGAEFIDVYSAFEVLGNWDDLMYDSTHQNAAGNDLYAQTILKHFPLDFSGSVVAPTTRSLYGVDKVNMDAVNLGYPVNAAPGVLNGVTYLCGGSGWVSEVTSTVGDYLEVSANSVELVAQLSTAVADAAIVDISIDGDVVASDINLSTQGKNGDYWVPFATGLTPGQHALRLTLKPGTLRTYSVAALIAGVSSFTPEQRIVDFGSHVGTENIDATGAFTTHLTAALQMPSGWTKMLAIFEGYIQTETNPATGTPTITQRQYQCQILLGSTSLYQPQISHPPTPDKFFVPVKMDTPVEITTADSQGVYLRTRMMSTDKDHAAVTGWGLKATLVRTA